MVVGGDKRGLHRFVKREGGERVAAPGCSGDEEVPVAGGGGEGCHGCILLFSCCCSAWRAARLDGFSRQCRKSDVVLRHLQMAIDS